MSTIFYDLLIVSTSFYGFLVLSTMMMMVMMINDDDGDDEGDRDDHDDKNSKFTLIECESISVGVGHVFAHQISTLKRDRMIVMVVAHSSGRSTTFSALSKQSTHFQRFK